VSAALARYLPFLLWLPAYGRDALRGDLFAGLSLAAFAIPESIAYATLAGLPPVTGLYCYLVGGVGYALFGTSRRVAIGPTSAIALLLASSLLPLAHGDVARYALLAAATATLVGIIGVVGRLVRIGSVVTFLSTVVTTGFTAGAALFIASTQLPKLFGLPDGSGNFFERIGALVQAAPQAHLPSVVLGVGAVAALLLLARRFPGRPTTLAVVVVVLILMHVGAVGHLGIRIVGHIPNGLPWPSLPLAAVSGNDLQQLLPIALACFILSFVETITTGNTLAAAHGDVIDPEQELLALGAANLTTGAFGGLPVSGGISQSAVNDLAGARSPLALVITSGAIALVLLYLAAFFSVTPDPLLGAIVVVAAIRLVRVKHIVEVWSASRHEFWVAIFAAIAVLATGLLYGVGLAVVFSLLMVLVRASRPIIAVLGELPGTTTYVNVARNPDAVRQPGVLAVRVLGPWQFFNAAFIRSCILQLVDAAPDKLGLVVIDFSASPTLDIESVGMLKTIDDELRARGIRLRLARLYDETANKLRRMHNLREPFDSHETVHDVVASYRPA
jgi:SulP family sulfate permease